jgi:quercetin dioxygenase-like cupin family protein
MIQQEISRIFEEGSIIFPKYSTDANSKPWYNPPGWNGVFLRDLITENETRGKFTYHLVRIQDHCEVPKHDHATQWEFNLILSGNGQFLFGNEKIPIKIGQTYITPPGTNHTVQAKTRDLVLLALFIPAMT